MKSLDLEFAYQNEARLANAANLSVPVAIAIQQLLATRELLAAIERQTEILSALSAVLSKPAASSAVPTPISTPTKKDSRP